jgi:hypothetical protein
MSSRPKHYRLQYKSTKEYVFAVTRQYFEEDNVTELTVGGIAKKCVKIHVFHEITDCSLLDQKSIQVNGRGTKANPMGCTRPTKLDSGDTKPCYAVLADVFYHAHCHFATDLEQSVGTRALLHASLACLLIFFPSVKYMIFDDNAMVNCDRIPMKRGTDWGSRPVGFCKADHNMLKYGQTWYQRVFPSLVPHGKEYKQQYKHFVKSLQAKIPEHLKTQDMFLSIWKQVHQTTFMQWNKPWSEKEDVRAEAAHQFVHVAETYQAFFTWLCHYVESFDVLYIQDTTSHVIRPLSTAPLHCTFAKEYFLERLKPWLHVLNIRTLAMTPWILDLTNAPRPGVLDGVVVNRTRVHDGQTFQVIKRVFPSAATNSMWL